MLSPKILVFSGSTRSASYNSRLAALAAKEIVLAGGEVTRISLEDYPLPIYDANSEHSGGAPPHAVQLKQQISLHRVSSSPARNTTPP